MSGSQSQYTVVIPARANTPSTLYLGWYAKHPQDTVQYVIDATALLYFTGRTLVSATVVSNDEDLVVSNVGAGGGLTTFTAAGGADVSTYGLTWTATLDDGSTITRVIWLPVLSMFPNTTTPTVIAKGDPGTPGVINSANMTAWLVTLPTAAPGSGWWNNGGVPTYVAG